MNNRQPFLLAAAVFVPALTLSLSMGGFIDDLIHPTWGRDTPLSEILSLQAGPFPIRLVLWKLAAWLRPERPCDLMHALSALLHAVNAGLVLVMLRQFISARAALLWAIFFAIYRPANEGVLWASTQPDVMATTWSLLALLAWRRGMQEPRWRAVGAGLDGGDSSVPGQG